jgi:hypothetical protein
MKIKFLIEFENRFGLGVSSADFHIEEFKYFCNEGVESPETDEFLNFLFVIDVVSKDFIVPVDDFFVLFDQIVETGDFVFLKKFDQPDSGIFLKVFFESACLPEYFLARKVDSCLDASTSVDEDQLVVA